MSPTRDPIDIRDHMKPPKSVREFMDRAQADPKERRAIEKLTDKMRAEQDDTGRCSRCRQNSSLVREDGELVTLCCGWPGVDPSDAVDARDDATGTA